jgi:ABC-type branched-subunit amino acid transport system substrate-binding protein
MTLAGRIAFTVVLLATAGCGARLDDDEHAIRAGGGAPAVSSTTTTTLAPGRPATGVGGLTIDAGPTGDTGAPAEQAAPVEAAAACTPQPSDEIGVSDDEIVLGNVSMLSGPIPGAGQPGVDGTRAYLEYVNSTGGVCGRRLRLETGDDRTDSGQNRAETIRLSRDVLAFVGGASIVDGGAAAALDGTNIPAVQVAVDNAALASPNFFSPSPIEPTNTTLGSVPMWRYFQRSLGLQRTAVVTLSLPSARDRARTYVADMEAAGMTVVGFHEVGLAETNFVGVAQQLENEGAEGFISLLDPVASARLAGAIAQIGYDPLVAHYGAQNYGRYFVELAGPAAEGALLPLAFDIFENTANPAVARFVEWFGRVAPGRDPDFYAAMGWASADMLVAAIEAAGPAPTRDAVLANLRATTTFDAHGFLAPCNPAGKVTSPLFMVATVEGGEWRRVYPASGFADGS